MFFRPGAPVLGNEQSAITRCRLISRLSRRWLSPLPLAALSVLGTASAQEQRGAIEGVVRDTQGGVVPGVVVVAQLAGAAVVETVTDAAGAYRFAALTPGRYDVSARLEGFLPARVVDIQLGLGGQLSIDLTLAPAGLAETVEVIAESPLLSITQNARGTNLRNEAIEKLPRGRDFTSLAIQAPGINEESKLGGISIDGSSGAENRIIIDGMETTDTWIGTPGQFLVTDFVEELQIKSSGYSAEFGGSTGGVLNAITKSGNNTWRGDVLMYLSGDALDAGPRPTLQIAPADSSRAEYVTFPEDDYRLLEPGFTMGGPILRDRLWFFGGYVPSFRPLDRTVTFSPSGETRTFTQDLTRHNVATNVTARPGARWRTRAAFSTGNQARKGLLPALNGTSTPAADYTIDEINPNYSASVGIDFTHGSRLYLAARTGYFSKNVYNEGVYRGDRFQYQTSSLGMAGVPPTYQQPRDYANVPSNIGRDRGKGPHFGAQVDATLFFSTAGQHQLKSGVQFDRVGIDTLAGSTGNGIAVFWDQSFVGVRGPFGYYRVQSNDRFPNLGVINQGRATVSNWGLFVQDVWRFGPRVTVHLGLRAENERVPSLSPDPRIPKTAIRFGFADKLAPRLGVAWDLTGDGKTKAYGSWGVFHDITKLQLSFGFGGFSSVAYFYTLDSGDLGPIVDNPDCPPACPGRLIRRSDPPVSPNDPDNNTIDPDLQQMRLQEAVVGVERELSPILTVSARYIHKQLDRVIEDVGTREAPQALLSIWIANPGSGRGAAFYPQDGTTPIAIPRPKRDYDAIEIEADRRLSNGWTARLSYTWSRLHGNYSGLAHSDEEGRVAPNIGSAYDYPLRSFDERGQAVYGPLATDRPHQLKAHLLVDLPFGTSVGARWIGASGAPRTREAAFFPGVGVMYEGRLSDGRLPFLRQTDLYVQHQIGLGSRLRLTLSANVLNLLDQSTATDYFPDELFAGQLITVSEAQFFQGIDTQALIAQQRLVGDPRFLMSSGFQAPRTVRLGIKLSF